MKLHWIFWSENQTCLSRMRRMYFMACWNRRRETGQVEDKIKLNLNPFVHKNTIPRTKDTNVLDRYLQLISPETERVSKSREKPKSFSPRVCFPLVLQCPLLFPASVDRTTPHCLSNYLNSKQYYLKIK